jgi:phosphomannomutase
MNPSIKPNNLMISVSGIRGKIPDGLTLETISLYTNAFIETLYPRKVVLGRDSRPSGIFMEMIITGILLAKGIDVISLGVVPTPTLKAVVKSSNASGGIMISASHNPIEWNAFKFVGKNGFFFNNPQIQNLLSHSQKKDFREIKFLPKSKIDSNSKDFIQTHIDSVLKRVDVQKIKKKKFKVFLDAVNGAGSEVVPKLLDALGCKVERLYCDPSKPFPREPEPTPSALQKTSRLMKKTDADIGFALDPDADRLVVLSPNRGAISEEYTLPLSMESVLPSKKQNMVINLSTSFINEEIAEKYNKNIIRSMVGEANVVNDMLQSNAFFGGEGNGGVIDPEVISFGRDSLSGIAHILNVLALKNKSIDSILDEYPEIFMKKETIPVKGKNLNSIKNKLKDSYFYNKMDERDGLRITLENSWFHVRASNTEPILRVIAEAKSSTDLDALLKKVNSLIKSA